jgi:hypothetical protein
MPSFRRNRAYTVVRKNRIRPPGLRGRRKATPGTKAEIISFRVEPWLMKMTYKLAAIKGYKLQDRLRAVMADDLASALGIPVDELHAHFGEDSGQQSG